jgi:PAS domain S-box-containing protein
MDVKKLLQLSTDLICTVNHHDCFVEVSNAAYSLLGYLPKEMEGRNYREFIYPGDLPLAEQEVDVIKYDQNTQVQIRYIHKNGSLVPMFWSVNWDPEGQLMYCIARCGDITQQTEAMRISLEESNQRYQYVTQATSDAIWDWDIVNHTLYWGEGFETIFGYNPTNLPPGVDSWTKHIHPDDLDYILKSLDTICKSNKTNWKEEYRYQKSDGTYADVVDRGFVIRDKAGIAIRMVGAMHDISERKKTLHEMNQVTADLFKRNRELHEFGYFVSHHLRSPVANIKGIAMLLETESDTPDTLKLYLDKLHSSVARLDETIIDLGKILNSKNSNADLNLEPLNLAEIIEAVKTDLEEMIVQSQTKIQLSGGNYLIGSNKVYIHSIFYNLIANSIKFKQDYPVRINIDLTYENQKIVITYEDNGSGIDLLRYGADIFKPFRKFHSTINGKGLGLFLVRRYIEALDGNIEIKSEPNQGVYYTITLPQLL